MKPHSLLYVISSFFFLPACGQQSLEEKLESIYRHTVPLVQPEQLENWQVSGKELILLDIRSPKEYQVSHLKGAELIDYESFDPGIIAHISKTSTVVVYCSVGYRSERVGEKLKELGFQEVYNLYGGIFQWKNQGNPVVNDKNQPTDSVHAYNRSWGKYLKQGIKIYD